MRRIVCCILVLTLLLVSSCAPASDLPLLRIHFFDVGQGDAILLRTPEGDILIDAGTDASEQELCLRLKQLGVLELQLAVFTHPDEDHIGGADGVLSRFPAKEVWLGDGEATGESIERLFKAISKTDTLLHTVRAGEVRRFGELVISVLAPLHDSYKDTNEGSIVLKLHCGDFDAILTGDAGAKQEAELLLRYGVSQLACDLYKVGHHGSNTSSSLDFLQALKPTYAVISCGDANSYGHPFGEVLANLEAVGATVLRTDLQGEIILETDGTSVSYRALP